MQIGNKRKLIIYAVEPTEDTNNVDETKVVCGMCCSRRGVCRRCCGKASEVPPNVEFRPQTREFFLSSFNNFLSIFNGH